MDKAITSFRGEYYYLSNFYMAPVSYDGYTFTNNETAFQAQKCKNSASILSFITMNPSEAKAYGQNITPRPDWEDVKVGIMYHIVLAKFTQNPSLKAKLLATGNAHLEEGNNWGDKTWGTVNDVGQNYLGRILMTVRDKMRNKSESEKELVLVETKNCEYNGYIMQDGHYQRIFNATKGFLFMIIKDWTDKGYSIKCLNQEEGKAFMKGRGALEAFMDEHKEIVIWRYDVSSPFAFGRKPNIPIGTTIRLSDYDIKILHKCYAAVVIEQGPAKGVYEVTSGGLVGDTVADVNADIDACENMEVMDEQIMNAAAIRDNSIKMVSNEEFGIVRGN